MAVKASSGTVVLGYRYTLAKINGGTDIFGSTIRLP